MRVVALLSGGKDSILNACHCVAKGHELVAIAHLYSQTGLELDSYMYQTVGNEAIELLAECMCLPLYKQPIQGSSLCTQLTYDGQHEGDEVEDLFRLLSRIKRDISIEAIASGAILSDYQRIRIEQVCRRLNLQHFAFLWRKDPWLVLNECQTIGIQAILVKTATIGLKPEVHLGKFLTDMKEDLQNIEQLYGVNVCGEGGEYETWTLDSPLFKKRMSLTDFKILMHSSDPFAPVGYLQIKDLQLHDKSETQYREGLCRMYDQLRKDSILELVIPRGENVSSFDETSLEIITGGGFSNHISSIVDDIIVESYSTKTYEVPPASRYHRQLITSGEYDSIDEYIHLEGRSMTEAINEVLCRVILRSGSIVLVHVFIKEFKLMVEMNRAYEAFFLNESLALPTRVAMAWPLKDGDILLRFLLFHRGYDTLTSSPLVSRYLCVTSRSSWAPTPIGAYSQSLETSDHRIFISGQIGLLPSTMELCHEATFFQESMLSLRHVSQIAKAMGNSKESIQAMTLYITCSDHTSIALSCLKTLFNGDHRPMISLIILPEQSNLPRGARIEWEAVYQYYP